jgi:hypothetical protein
MVPKLGPYTIMIVLKFVPPKLFEEFLYIWNEFNLNVLIKFHILNILSIKNSNSNGIQ